MTQIKTAPGGNPGAAVTKASVDDAEDTANNSETQALINGWWLASEWHRDLALTASSTLQRDPEAAVALRIDLMNRRHLVRELRHAAFVGGR